MKYYTYTLLSLKDRKFYTGYTTDLHERTRKHKEGKVFSTKSRLPVKLIYYEVCGSMKDAQAREKYLHSGMGRRYLRNRLKHYLLNL